MQQTQQTHKHSNIRQTHKKKKEISDVVSLLFLLYKSLWAHRGCGSLVTDSGSVLKIKIALHPTDSDPRGVAVQRLLVVAHSTSSISGPSLAALMRQKMRYHQGVLRHIPLYNGLLFFGTWHTMENFWKTKNHFI